MISQVVTFRKLIDNDILMFMETIDGWSFYAMEEKHHMVLHAEDTMAVISGGEMTDDTFVLKTINSPDNEDEEYTFKNIHLKTSMRNSK